MLESLEHSNIKRMSLESPETAETGWFDVEKEITQDDRDMIHKSLRTDAEQGRLGVFIVKASAMKDLGLLEYGITAEDVQSMTNMLKRYKIVGNWSDFAWFAQRAKNLGIDVEITPDDEKSIMQALAKSRDKDSLPDSFLFMYDLRKLGMVVELGPYEKTDMVGRLEQSREFGNYDIFSNDAARLKEMGEQVGVSQGDIGGMKVVLDGWRSTQRWFDFSRVARDMRVLSEPAMRPSELQANPGQIPEQRNF